MGADIISPVKKAHIICDFYKAEPEILAKADLLKESILRALGLFKIEVEINTFYQFEPYGVTALVTSPELHFNIHTWPEHASCAIDMYCMEGNQYGVKVWEELKKQFKADEYQIKVLKRDKKLKASN